MFPAVEPTPDERLQRESRRVVDRLRATPFARIASTVEPARQAAEQILRILGPWESEMPAALPPVPDNSWGDVLAVLAHDTAGCSDAEVLTAVADVFAELRMHL